MASVTLLAASAIALVAAAPAAAVNTTTFQYTGAPQVWTVPAGVTSATFDLFGGAGGQTSPSEATRGGRATATIAVTPLEEILVYVGGEGADEVLGSAAFNGGGASTGLYARGGGGASDIRRGGTALANRLVIAGGGGGDGGCQSAGAYPAGGLGGGLLGGAGVVNEECANGSSGGGAGGGGTQSAGGAASPGEDTTAGTLGVGGQAGKYGGGGGGGYYGGGGAMTGGGGGGSGFGPTGTSFETGVREGNGLVAITYAASPLAIVGAGAGRGYVDSSVTGIDCGRNSATHADCDQVYSDGTVVTITAHPGLNTVFSGFSGGGCSGTALTCELTMSEARSVTATFTLEVRPLNVTTSGSGSGYVDSVPAGIDCGRDAPAHAECSIEPELGSQVTLTAHPAPNTTFTGFSGGGCASGATVCTLTMDAAKSIGAPFQLTRTLIVATSGAGGGTVSGPGFDCGGAGHVDCAETIADGSQIQLTATPAPGSEFVGFKGSCTGAVAVCTATITAESKVEAVFATAPDTTPPQTKISSKPSEVGPPRSIFQLRSSQPGSRFECRLDSAKFKPCGKRVEYRNLKPGRHTFRARAIDAAGNVDPSPAVVRFRVGPAAR
jgi:hypothetical protein